MEMQGRSTLTVSTLKPPPGHEMRDLVDELLCAPWDVRDTSSSSSDSLSPRAPLADMSSELQDFNIQERDDLFQTELKLAEIDENFKKAVKLEIQEYKGVVENYEEVMISYSPETEENIWEVRSENSEKTFMDTELEDKEYMRSVKSNDCNMAAVIYGTEREENKGKLEKNSEKTMMILKAEGECQGVSEVCDLNQSVVGFGVGTENCKEIMHEDNNELPVTFSEIQKNKHERRNESEDFGNVKFLSEIPTEGSMCWVTDEAGEDNVGNIEYPESVSKTGGPHRRTIAAEDGGAIPQCVGTLGFFHMQPETEQVVWQSRWASDRDPSISVTGINHEVDISAVKSCASVEQAIIPTNNNVLHKCTDVEGKNGNINPVSQNNANIKQFCVPSDISKAEINTNAKDKNEETIAVSNRISSNTETLNVAAPEKNTSNGYQIISSGKELISDMNRDSTIAVGLNVGSAQETGNVGEMRAETRIVSDNAMSPIKESPNTEAVCATAALEGLRDETFSDVECRNAPLTDAADVRGNLSETETVHFGDKTTRAGNESVTRTCSVEKYVQTDSVSASYSEVISDKSSELRILPAVSVDKFVQTDYLSVSPREKVVSIHKTESSVSLHDLKIIGALIVDEDRDQTSVHSVLPFFRTNDLVKVSERPQLVSTSEYYDEGEEIRGISSSFVSGDSKLNSTISVSESNQVLEKLVNARKLTVTQPETVSVSSENADGTEDFNGGRLDHNETINAECEAASVSEEGRLLTEGLSCTLQLLSYRDGLFPPLCPSCLLPQSAVSIRQGGTRVHNSAQNKSDLISDHVTVLGHTEDTSLNGRDNVLEPEYAVDRLCSVKDDGNGNFSAYQYRDKVQRPLNDPTEDCLRIVKHDTESGSRRVTAVHGSVVPADITSLLYQPQYGDYSVKNGSYVTREKDVSPRKPLDQTSSGDNVKISRICRHGDEMGGQYSTQESEDSEAHQCHTDSIDGGAEETEPDGINAGLKVMSDCAVTNFTDITNIDFKNVSLSVTSDCADKDTDLGLINTDTSNVGMGLSTDDATVTAVDTDHINVALRMTNKDENRDTMTGDLKYCWLDYTNQNGTHIERANTEQRNVVLSETCEIENTNKTSVVDYSNVGLSSIADGAATCIVPTTTEQLIGATRSDNRSNTSFPFIDKEDNAANEATAVAMTTRDNIRLDIDRCVASFQRDHVLDRLHASGDGGIPCETTPDENDLSKSDEGHDGAVVTHSSDKETQTAVDVSTITTSVVAMRNTVDKETQTKAVGREGSDDTKQATPTKQIECAEAKGGVGKAPTETATESKQRNEEEGIKVATAESHPCTAPSSTASPLSKGDERRTSSGDIGSEAAHDGTICAAADSSEQDAPESGRAEASRIPVPRDQAPVHRASDAAVPRDKVSAVGNRCGDAMRQKNKTNDNEAAPADKSVIIANGGTSTEAASGAANDCNGHVNNHHHHSTARSILKSVLKRTGNGGHHKKTAGSKAALVPSPPPPPQQQPPPPQNQPAPKKKHRVQFDESKNKFFDADYVILIREEDEEEEEEDEEGEEEEMEDEEEVCTCGATAEMGRLLPPIVGTVKTPPPAGCGRPIQPPGGAVQVLLRTPGTCQHV